MPVDHDKRISELSALLRKINSPIYIGYSGGKDSSAVVSLIWRCLQTRQVTDTPVTIVYCDTQVENPIIDHHAKSSLKRIAREARSHGLEIRSKIIQPRIDQGFFVRIIGRGYPTPTNSFRWCTTDIRIRPLRHFLARRRHATWIAIGTRWGESQQRDRALERFVSSKRGEKFIQRQREGFPNASLITPIIDYGVDDVWELLCEGRGPKAIDPFSLAKLYKDASGECPTLRDFKDKPCSKSRFGCWTCTVVRRDRSAQNLITAGYNELEPLSRFRDWLIEMRNDPAMRCKRRRNGSEGLGPFTIEARRLLLSGLTQLERDTGRTILTLEQRAMIRTLIESDRRSVRYKKIELGQ